MSLNNQSADTIAAIVFGLLQLAVGLVSLWQQRRLRQAYREYYDKLVRNRID